MSPIFAREARLALRAAALGAALLVALFTLWPQTAHAALCSVPSGPYPTIQSAISDANCDPIHVAAGTYTEALSITRSVSIFGVDTASTFVNGNNNSRPLTVNGLGAGITVRVHGLTLANGNASSAPPSLGSGGLFRIGGGILAWNGATLHLENVRVTGNRARGNAASTGGGLGGGIGIYNRATLHATNVTIDNNIANVATHGGFGGGIAVLHGSMVLTDTNIAVNVGYSGTAPSGDGLGGGIYVDDDPGLGIDQTSQFSLYSSAIYSNTAIQSTSTGDGLGGGLYAGSPTTYTIIATGNTWYDNQARSAGSGKGVGNGGAIAVTLDSATATQLIVSGDVFYQNVANGAADLDNPSQQAQGGGLYLDANDSGWFTVTLTNAVIYSNTAQSGSGANTYGQGGGIWTHLAALEIADSLFSGNTARSDGSGEGGAIRAFGAQLTVERSKLSDNRAELGGALHLFNSALDPGYVDLTNVMVVDNDGITEDVHIQNLNGGVTNYLRHVTLARQAPVIGQSGLRTAGTFAISNTIVTSYTVGILNTGGSVGGTNNLFFGNTTNTMGIVNFSNPVTGDPRFVNPAAYDYHIRDNSAARNAGLNIGVLDDFDGQPRTGAPDVGADEHHDQAIKGLTIVGPSTGTAGTPISLTVQITSGTNVAYTWDFGDGGTDSGESVNHTYVHTGTYFVVVTGTNSLGPVTAGKTIAILADGDDDPIAGLVAANSSPTLKGNITVLSATVTAGSSISYTWDFGDGELGNGPTPAHTYASSGVYTATVIASNDAGTEQAQTIVYVGDALVDVGPGGQDVFSPKDVTIPAGGTVIWTLRSGFHSVTADDGSFLQPLGSDWDHFAHTFPSSQVAAAATFRYYCEAHGGPGGSGMAGTVTVSSAPADGPTLHMPYVSRQQP